MDLLTSTEPGWSMIMDLEVDRRVLVWAEGPPLSHWSRWLGNENGHQVS